MKDRKRQRENRRLKNKEELIDRRNNCGVKDLTAYNAGYRTKRVGKNLYYACIKGRIRGILKYA